MKIITVILVMMFAISFAVGRGQSQTDNSESYGIPYLDSFMILCCWNSKYYVCRLTHILDGLRLRKLVNIILICLTTVL